MKTTAIMKSAKTTLKKMTFKIDKHSPEILVVAGAVGVVVSAVMACKATLKAREVVEETKSDLDKIHECMGNQTLKEEGTYTDEDGKKDLVRVYTKTAVNMAKLYGPAVALGALSLTSILASNDILRKRNAAIAAAYATVDRSFKEYRGRVVERFGEKVDKELKYNIKAEEVEETVTDEKGKTKTVKKTLNVVDPNTISDYARFFDVGNPYWEKDSEYNLMFLKSRQAQANDILKSRGRLYLNEVYRMLGLEETKAGQVVGWVYDEDCPVGDNFVDFGIYDMEDVAKRNFVNGYERTILLDFNVDGNIWDLM